MKRRSIQVMLLPAFVWVVAVLPAYGQDEAHESAAWMLRKATMPTGDGGHHVLLRSLRQMRDPKLKGFFTALLSHEQPAMRYHGVIGLAELSEPREIDLEQLVEMKEALLQAQIVGTAIEDGLMSDEQCRQVYESSGFDPAVRIIAATKLVELGLLKDLSALSGVAQSDKSAMRGMLALLKGQLGDRDALTTLRELGSAADPNIDEVRMMLLSTAVKSKMSSAGAWAMELANEGEATKPLAFLALRAAMRFSEPGAQGLWKKRFAEAAERPADRIRLMLLALDAAEVVDESLFEGHTGDADPLVAKVAEVGRCIAAKEPVDDALMRLVEMNHALSGEWALQYTMKLEPEKARSLLIAFILAAEGEPNESRNRSLRIEHCVFATQKLLEADPSSRGVVAGLLNDSPVLTQEAMLMGVLKAQAVEAHRVLEGAELKSDVSRAIALLIRARAGEPLDEGERKELSLLVRGGAGLKETLRLQAGWVYLKLEGRDAEALETIFQD